MIIRAAREKDAAQIAAIQNPVIRDTAITFNAQEKTTDEIATAIRELPCFIVAEDGEQLLGFVSYLPFRRGVGLCAHHGAHDSFSPVRREGRGVGRALMVAAEDHARAAGVGSLWAGISGENPDGVVFHASVGFEEVARLPKVGFKFGRWMDLILMRKWLDP